MASRAQRVAVPAPAPAKAALRAPSSARRGTPARFLELTAELSSRMANAPYQELPEAARSSLASLLEFFELDRCAILRVSEHPGTLQVRCKVERSDGETMPAVMEVRQAFPWSFDQVITRREPLVFSDLSDLPAAAVRDRDSFRRLGTRSLLLLPIISNGQVDHVVTMATVRRRRSWAVEQVKRLHLLSERIVGALRRRDQFEAREANERFESLLTDLSSRFAGARWDQVDQQIDHSLQQLLDFTGVDQCGFFTVHADEGCSTLTHLASHDVTVARGSRVPHNVLVPWLWQEVVRKGRVVCFSDPAELPQAAQQDRLQLATRPVTSGVYIPYASDGVTRHMLAVVVNTKPGRHWPARFVDRVQVLGGVFASALDRKVAVGSQLQATQDLAANRRLAQSTLDALNEYVCVVDAAGVIAETNDRWRSLGKDDPAAPENVPVGGDFVGACSAARGPWRAHAKALAQGIRQVLAGTQEQFHLEYPRPLPDGKIQLQTLVRRFTVDGAVFAAISHTDISERHRTQQELDEMRLSQWHSDRVMRTGVLVASLAHELSQPLAAILSNSQAALRFLAAGTAEPQELVDILSDIVEDDKRAARVIEALRRMLRRQEPERRQVDLCEVVRDMAQLLHSEFIRQHIQLDEECGHGSVAMVDRGQIQQVVLNLVMNAIEAMEEVSYEQRRLGIRVHVNEQDEVWVEVSDSGPGFSDEQLARPFEAFWTTKRRGTGLGLAICSSIVSSHGGRMALERNPGGGARVLVALPAVHVDETQ